MAKSRTTFHARKNATSWKHWTSTHKWTTWSGVTSETTSGPAEDGRTESRDSQTTLHYQSRQQLDVGELGLEDVGPLGDMDLPSSNKTTWSVFPDAVAGSDDVLDSSAAVTGIATGIALCGALAILAVIVAVFYLHRRGLGRQKNVVKMENPIYSNEKLKATCTYSKGVVLFVGPTANLLRQSNEGSLATLGSESTPEDCRLESPRTLEFYKPRSGRARVTALRKPLYCEAELLDEHAEPDGESDKEEDMELYRQEDGDHSSPPPQPRDKSSHDDSLVEQDTAEKSC